MATVVQDKVFFQEKLPNNFIHMKNYRPMPTQKGKVSSKSSQVMFHMELTYMSSTERLLHHKMQ